MPDDTTTASLNMRTLRLRHQHPSNENNLLLRQTSKYMKFGKLILRKIIKIFATR